MIERMIHDLARHGPLGYALLALLVLGLLSPLLLILVARRFQGRGAIVLWIHALISVALLALVAVLMHKTRSDTLVILLDPVRRGPSFSLRAMAELAEETAKAQCVPSLFTLVVVPVLATVLGIRRLRARRASARRKPGIAAVLAIAAVIPWFSALGVLSHVNEKRSGAWGCETAACRYEAWVGSLHSLAMAGSGILAAAIAASIVLPLIVWFRPLHLRAWWLRFGLMAALASSVWVYCLVRPLAHDASSPLALSENPELPDRIDLPRADRCEAFADGPVVADDDGGLNVDGIAVTAGDLSALLANKRRLWQQINPREVFPGVLNVLLDAHYPAWEAGKIVRAARQQGYRDVRVGVAVPPRAVDTHTVGRVEYKPRWCSIRLRGHVDWAAASSWGDVVEETAQRRVLVRD